MGTLGSALGICYLCSTSVCGFHGARTIKGQFGCLRCEPAVAAKSAGYAAWKQAEEAAGGQDGLGDPIETGVAVRLMAGAGSRTSAGSPDCCLVGPLGLGDRCAGG
jgi:hypothetical protein